MRLKPANLEVLEILASRMELPAQAADYKDRLYKGYLGELQVDELIASSSVPALVLKDLYLSDIKSSHIQIDTLLISNGHLLMLEIKNYEGTYVVEGDKLRHPSGLVLQNPKTQVHKAELILKSILKAAGIYHYQITPQIIYCHDNFILHNSTSNDLCLSLTNFNHRLRTNSYGLNGITHLDQKIASAIQARVKNYEHRHELIPDFDFYSLEKKLACPNCRGEMVRVTRRTYHCEACQSKFIKSKVLNFNIRDFETLFKRLPTYQELFVWIDQKAPLKTCSNQLTNYKKSRAKWLPPLKL